MTPFRVREAEPRSLFPARPAGGVPPAGDSAGALDIHAVGALAAAIKRTITPSESPTVIPTDCNVAGDPCAAAPIIGRGHTSKGIHQASTNVSVLASSPSHPVSGVTTRYPSGWSSRRAAPATILRCPRSPTTSSTAWAAASASFVVENAAAAARQATCHFYRTTGGAEIDLLLAWPDGSLWALEIQHSLVPRVDREFSSACDDLHPTRRFVVYPGQDRRPPGDDVELVRLAPLVAVSRLKVEKKPSPALRCRRRVLRLPFILSSSDRDRVV